jgi:hypothetical protein
VTEGEEVLAVNRLNRKDNASGEDDSLLRVARRRWLQHMRRGVAYGAIRVGQPIVMKVRLLERGAEEEKNGAQDGKHETFTFLQYPVLAHSSHGYRLLYSTWMESR